MLASKKKAVVVSFRLDTKILTADRTAGSAAVYKAVIVINIVIFIVIVVVRFVVIDMILIVIVAANVSQVVRPLNTDLSQRKFVLCVLIAQSGHHALTPMMGRTQLTCLRGFDPGFRAIRYTSRKRLESGGAWFVFIIQSLLAWRTRLMMKRNACM